jgi:hypothetical protein
MVLLRLRGPMPMSLALVPPVETVIRWVMSAVPPGLLEAQRVLAVVPPVLQLAPRRVQPVPPSHRDAQWQQPPQLCAGHRSLRRAYRSMSGWSARERLPQ